MRIPAACLVAAIAIIAGCSPRPAGVDDFQILREYGWDMPLADPQAAFNPQNNQVAAHAPDGFAVLDEGGGKQGFFRGQSGREGFWPEWIHGYQFVIGGSANAEKLADGRVVPPTEGLTVISVRDDGTVRERQLARVGFRPRYWAARKRIVAQIENKLWLFDQEGEGEDYGEGFYAVPQRKGDGLAYQETPVFEADHWTAKPVLGRLFVQWGDRNRVSEIPGAVEPSWTATGGVVATALRGDPAKDQPWYHAPTELVHLGGQGHRVETIVADLHGPAAHPTQPIVAATTKDGRLVLVSLVDKRVRELAPVGAHAQWNHDGTRLMAQEPVLDKPDASYLRVYVFKIVPGDKKK